MTRIKKIENIIRPKISVVLLAGDDENVISEVMDSVLAQTLTDIEILVINKDSQDTTFSKCASYMETDPRVSLFSREDTSLDNLLKLTNGDYILISDTRTLLLDEALETLYYKAEASKDDFVFSNYRLPNKDTAIKEDLSYATPFSLWDKRPDKILNLSPYVFQNKLYRRDFFQKVLKKAKSYKIADKIDFPSLAFILADRIGYAQKALMEFLKETPSFETLDWKKSIVSLTGLELFLNREATYSAIEQSFLNYALEKLVYLTDSPEPYQSIVANYLVNEATPYFNFLNHPSTYYYNPSLWGKYKELLKRENISPALESFYLDKADKIIPIVITPINDTKLNATMVVIQSIREHLSSDYFYDLYILTENRQMRDHFEGFPSENLRVTYMNVSDKLPPNFRKKYTTGLYIGLLPQLFSGYSKILCLNPNTLVQTDLSVFAQIDLKNYVAAGTLAYADASHVEKDLGLIYETYISTDVLWLDLEQCNEESFSKPFFSLVAQKYNTQEAINIVLKNKIMVLPPKYNGLTNLIFQRADMDYYPYNEDDFYILSYNSKHPLDTLGVPLAHIWWTYARRNRFYEEILLYFLKMTAVPSQVRKEPIPPPPSPQPPQKTPSPSEEDVYNYQKGFIKTALLSFFSIGQTRKLAKQKLQEMLENGK